MPRSRLALLLALLIPLGGCGTVPTPQETAERARAAEANAFADAAAHGRADEVRAFLDKGGDPNAGAGKDTGFNPLSGAAYFGRAEIVKLLLDRGADVETKTVEAVTFTPLAFAAMQGHNDIVRMLIAKGADAETAIDALERHAAMYAQYPSANDDKAGVKLLERLLRKENPPAQAQETASAPPSFHSDVDKPDYSLVERPDDFALVVGIEKYSDLPDAQFAERDAEAVKDHLIALGFPSRNVVLLRGDKAGYKSIEKYLETWLPRNVGEDSRVFFYFSGHGAPDVKTGLAYLVPWDGDAGFLENTGYPVKRLYKKLNSLKAKQVVVALDACFSGAGGRSVLAQGARPLVTQVDEGVVPSGKMTVFAAAAGNEITSTMMDQGHGTFTYYFLKGLSGRAKDASGKITPRGLEDYLKPKVQDAARRQNREQTPVLQGSAPDQELVQFGPSSRP
jgi:hypothetical protein